MKKLFVIAGTRPEIIKLAPLIIKARKDYADQLDIFFCLTGQHQQMAIQVLDIFSLQADYDLKLMESNQTLNSISSKIFLKLPDILKEVQPDYVIVQGDTTTAAMAGLTAFNMKIPVGHVEAGLRTNNLFSPFPEELNRKLISTFAKFNFAPTQNAKRNLLNDNVKAGSIVLVGNTVIDSLQYIIKNYKLEIPLNIRKKLTKPFILVTAHRRESFGIGFVNICNALKKCAINNPEFQFVYPLHLNPNVKNIVEEKLSNLDNFILTPPVSYLEFLSLLSQCEFCVTDSGGIQEEAPSFNKYTIVLRGFTERTESIDAGVSELVGTNPGKIINAFQSAVSRLNSSTNVIVNPFGDGKASERICETIVADS